MPGRSEHPLLTGGTHHVLLVTIGHVIIEDLVVSNLFKNTYYITRLPNEDIDLVYKFSTGYLLGHYEVHISVENTTTSLATQCKAFELPGIIKQHQTAIECNKVMSGDTVIVKKIDDGPLRLFEVYLLICPPNQFGPTCARCRQRCRSCDPVTGECIQCDGLYYGEYCQHNCPDHCLNMTCDQRTGYCNSCVDGYKGNTCEQYTDTNTKPLYCNHSFVTCEQNIKVCMLCISTLMLEACQYRCNEICSGSTCLEIQESKSVKKCDTTDYEVLEVQQTSTNGSFNASLGYDGDMDTFSLTNSGGNQSWSMTLKNKSRIIWIFVRIAADTTDYEILEVQQTSTNGSFNASLGCDGDMDTFSLTNSGGNQSWSMTLKNKSRIIWIFVRIAAGISQINPKRIQNFSDYTDPISKALDNNIVTYYTPHETKNASWFMELDAIYLMKWFLISIRGGTFELHIAAGKTLINSTTLCVAFNFPGLQQHQAAIECINATRGDTIVVRKIGQGSLRLFELIPINTSK
uniref:Multiple epidermal growth factor-like domains 6 n=1 Tax=Magallana gigas TaxID=29159 RepID=K1R5Z0_MAGGI